MTEQHEREAVAGAGWLPEIDSAVAGAGWLPEIDSAAYGPDSVALAAAPSEPFTLLGAVRTYLGAEDDTYVDWTAEQIEQAYAAERYAQARVCRVPSGEQAEHEWPMDLVEALCRRVAHNLAMRALPLGLSTSISEVGGTATRVGGTDAEVRRLERPHRKFVLG